VYGHCNGSDSDVSDEVHDGDGAGRDDDQSPSQSQGLASEQGSSQQSQAASSPTRSHAKEGAWLVNVVYENAQGEGDWIAPAELGDAAGEFRPASRKGGGGAKRKGAAAG
jgi:hypothetical protein